MSDINIESFLKTENSDDLKKCIKDINEINYNNNKRSYFWELFEILFVDDSVDKNEKIMKNWINGYINSTFDEQTDELLKAILLNDVESLNEIISSIDEDPYLKLKIFNTNSNDQLSNLKPFSNVFQNYHFYYKDQQAIPGEAINDLFSHNVRSISKYINDPITIVYINLKYCNNTKKIIGDILSLLTPEIKSNSSLSLILYYLEKDINNLLEILNPEEALLAFHFFMHTSNLNLFREKDFYIKNLIDRCCNYYIESEKWHYAYFLYNFYDYSEEASKILHRCVSPSLSFDSNEIVLIEKYNVDRALICNSKAKSLVYHASFCDKDYNRLNYLSKALKMASDRELTHTIFEKDFLPLFSRISKDFNYLTRVIDQSESLTDLITDPEMGFGILKDVRNFVTDNIDNVNPEHFVNELKRWDKSPICRDICVLAMQKDPNYFNYLNGNIESCPKLKYNLEI